MPFPTRSRSGCCRCPSSAIDGIGQIAKNQLSQIDLKYAPNHCEQVYEWTTAVDSKGFGILNLSWRIQSSDASPVLYRTAFRLFKKSGVAAPSTQSRSKYSLSAALEPASRCGSHNVPTVKPHDAGRRSICGGHAWLRSRWWRPCGHVRDSPASFTQGPKAL
jgi:hypothetical protein